MTAPMIAIDVTQRGRRVRHIETRIVPGMPAPITIAGDQFPDRLPVLV